MSRASFALCTSEISFASLVLAERAELGSNGLPNLKAGGSIEGDELVSNTFADAQIHELKCFEKTSGLQEHRARRKSVCRASDTR
jgi:hypothetical protein